MAPPVKIVRKNAKESTGGQFILANQSPFKNASVKDKIKKWNTEGGGLYGSENNDSSTSLDEELVVVVETESELSHSTKSKSDKSSRKSASDVKKSTSDVTPEVVAAIEDVDNKSSKKSDDGKSQKTEEKSSASRPRSATSPEVETASPAVAPSTPVRTKTMNPGQAPATAPAKSYMFTRRKNPPPAPPQPQVDLEEEIKMASAPKKRVISDGHWVRHRPKAVEPKPKPEPKKSPPKPPKPQLAWVRPPMLPRRAPGEHSGPTPQLEIDLSLPPMRTIAGKFKKPILHQFIPGSGANKLNPGITSANLKPEPVQRQASISSDDSLSSTTSVTEIPKVRKRRPPKEPPPESTILSESSLDLSIVDVKDNKLKRTPPRSAQYHRSTRGSDNIPPRRKSDQSPEERLHSSASRAEPKEHRRHHHRAKSEDPENLQARHRSGLLDDYAAQTRKPSYNAGDAIPVVDDEKKPSLFGGFPGRVAAWLTTTSDPFVEQTNSSNPKPSRRIFSFEREAPLDRPKEPEASMLRKAPANSSRRDRVREPTEVTLSDASTAETESTLSTLSTVTEQQSKVSKYSDYTESTIDRSSNASSTPTLKRNAARRNPDSPTKEKMRSKSVFSLHDTESDLSRSDASKSLTTSSHTASSYTESSIMTTSDQGAELMALKRPFPTTGKRLSTIASVETFATSKAVDAKAKPISGTPVEIPLKSGSRTGPKRNASIRTGTKLSKANSVLSTCSTRSNRSRLQLTVPELMAQLAIEESQYMPELRTLVGGVIKVLFKAVFSKSDAALAAGLFSKFSTEGGEQQAKYAIHEMGVALERLKSVHNCISKIDSVSFLVWAKNAHRIYAEYVRTWRLGFQDVVVNLVPADDTSVVSGKDLDAASMADALPQNADGFVVNQQGEMVDVAFLLKRPLVRLKNLTNTIKGINAAQPSPLAEELSKKYETLMENARKKINQEKARLEDQAAASIDTSRCRDPTSMGALSGVKIDPNRCVIARDFFEMHLIHSTGQEVLSRVELLLRNDAPGKGNDGDILICQSDGNKRWLFLPPVLLKHVSSRTGSVDTELVVMVQGVQFRGRSWHELFSLKTSEVEITEEWLALLGTKPIPPAFNRETLVKDIIPRPSSSQGSSLLSASAYTESTLSKYTRSPSPSGVDIPLGEKNGPDARKWGSGRHGQEVSQPTSPAAPYDDLPTHGAYSQADRHASNSRRTSQSKHESRRRSGGDERERHARSPRSLNEAMQMAGGATPLRRSKAQKRRSATISPTSRDIEEMEESRENRLPASEPRRPSDNSKSPPTKSPGFSVWIPNSDMVGNNMDDDEDTTLHFMTPTHRPSVHKRASSMPLRHKPDEYKHDDLSSHTASSVDDVSVISRGSAPTSPPHVSASKSQHRQGGALSSSVDDQPPPPPPHKTPIKQSSKLGSPPKLTPDSKVKRRSSSPLKQVWNHSESDSPHTESESDSGYYDELDTSESEDEQDDLVSNVMSSLSAYHPGGSQIPDAIAEEVDSVTPSQSASQGPSRDVPQPKQVFMVMLAEVSQWNPTVGEYTPIHSRECLCEIGNGKISAYEMIVDVNAPTGFQNRKRANADPVVALILTPSVIVQVLNSADILISSDLSWDSSFRRHDKIRRARIRFHSRSQINQQSVLGALHRGMHSNPVMAHLEANRPRETEAERFDKQNPGGQASREKSWWGGSRRTNSFRKTHTRSGSTVGNTEYSSRTTSSIRQGLNQLLAKTTSFNIDRSTILKKSQNSSGKEGDTNSTAPADVFSRYYPNEIQHVMRSTRCRVISWEKQRRSRVALNLGKVTMHVLHAPRGLTGEISGIRGPDGIHSGKGMRVVLANETKILLDQVLPPGSFSLDPRGIIVHIFDQKENGLVAQTGGVGTLTSSTFALTQFPSEGIRDWLFHTLTNDQAT